MGLALSFSPYVQAGNVSTLADKTARYAAETYYDDMVVSLGELVKFNTVAREGVSVFDNPVHQAFKAELARQAKELGLDFTDHGAVVVIGLGQGKERLGIVTHGDVQPANPAKWAKSPFELDMASEPGNIIGRGTEDDKGPISSALYAMKAIKDAGISLSKRIELYVYMAEESDWGPLEDFIREHELPGVNITLDSEYPVVTAEKGYGSLKMTFPDKAVTGKSPYLSRFSGGFFGSQIPEDAVAVIENTDAKLVKRLKAKAAGYKTLSFDFTAGGQRLTVKASGTSAHSSKPESGVNAITHLADLLADIRWPGNASGALVNFVNDYMGTGLYGEKFGDIAYRDDFMGPLTVQLTVLKQESNGIRLNINLRRPQGKSSEQLDKELRAALDRWQQKNKLTLLDISTWIGEPFVQENAPQTKTLLSVFSHYTGVKKPEPIAIGGSTNSKLFPNAVSFGPSMPGEVYSGHSEHEFISAAQFKLNLKMYTAVMIELAK
ncbi:dipeptidase [Thalassomonas viridans]|uniref:Dipeptidase n=2 Tax=Thalassomonas viridans TaxID=137584 RepID=A0AAE9ZAW9_9GAMM|nr:dipeptidase [Thalassomonas viridans]